MVRARYIFPWVALQFRRSFAAVMIDVYTLKPIRKLVGDCSSAGPAHVPPWVNLWSESVVIRQRERWSHKRRAMIAIYSLFQSSSMILKVCVAVINVSVIAGAIGLCYIDNGRRSPVIWPHAWKGRTLIAVGIKRRLRMLCWSWVTHLAQEWLVGSWRYSTELSPVTAVAVRIFESPHIWLQAECTQAGRCIPFGWHTIGTVYCDLASQSWGLYKHYLMYIHTHV